MKTILLLRHAKSEWDADYETDHERPLARRGRRAAALMGRFLAALDEVPDAVVSSTAVRAHDTVLRAAAKGKWTCPISTEPKLYESSEKGVLRVIRGLSDSFESVLLVGHEPIWSPMAGMLVGGANIRFPTAAVIRIDVEVDTWSDVQFGLGTFVWMVTPRQLEKIGWNGVQGSG